MKILKYIFLPFLFAGSLHASVLVEKEKEVDIHTNKEEEEVKPTNPPKSEASLLEWQFGSKQRMARKVVRKEWPTIKKEIIDNIEKAGKGSVDPYRSVFTRITMKKLEKELDDLNAERLIRELKTAKLDCSAENFKKYLAESFTNHVNTKMEEEFEKWKGVIKNQVENYCVKVLKKNKRYIEEHEILSFLFEQQNEESKNFQKLLNRSAEGGAIAIDMFYGFFRAITIGVTTPLAMIQVARKKKEYENTFSGKMMSIDRFSITNSFYSGEIETHIKIFVGGLFAGGLAWLIASLTGMGIPTLIAHLAKAISPKMAAKLMVMLGLSGGSGYAAKRLAQWLGAGGWAMIIGIIVALLIFLTTYFILQKQYPESFEEIRKGSVLMIYPLTILVLCLTPAIASYYLFKYMYYQVGLPTWQCVSAPFVLLLLLSIGSKIAIKKFTAVQQKAMEEEVGVDSKIAVWWKGLWKEEEEKKKGWSKKKIAASISVVVVALIAVWGGYKFFIKGQEAPKIKKLELEDDEV